MSEAAIAPMLGLFRQRIDEAFMRMSEYDRLITLCQQTVADLA